jgi:hypothetical protein
VPSFLIKVTWGRWQSDPPWLSAGELQAAALFDLRFSNNKLSMWKIEDDSSNLERILSALATSSGKTSIDNVDYVLLDQNLVQALGVKIEKSSGGTPDSVANRDWHYDCIELCVSDIVNIAKRIKTATISRKKEAEVKQMIQRGLKAKHIDIAQIEEPLKSKLLALI